MKFRMQVGVMDCLSCGNCVDVCPGNPKAGGPALKMVPLEGQLGEAANWEYCVKNMKTKQALVDIKQSPKKLPACSRLVKTWLRSATKATSACLRWIGLMNNLFD